MTVEQPVLHKKNNRLPASKKGFTLTEIAIVLGIIGLILGAIWTAAASVYANQRTGHANTAILQIAQGVRTLYSTSSDMGAGQADITAALVTAGAFPADLATNGPFPSGVTKVYTAKDGAAAQGFFIVMSGVPQASCINLLTQIGGATRDAGLFFAEGVANAAPAAPAIATGVPLPAPVSPVIAAAAAAANMGGCTAANNDVEFGFTLK